MKKRKLGYKEPQWYIDEYMPIVEEWANSGSSENVTDYILSHASDRFKKEFEHMKEVTSGVKDDVDERRRK